MAVDISGIGYFLPILTYLIVFIITYVVAKKSGFFASEGMNVFIGFVVATIFISAAGPRAYVSSIIPWFVVLLISLFLILALLKFADFGDWNKNIGKAFAVILIVAFVISGIFVFSSYFSPYLPWNSTAGVNTDVLTITDWIFSPRVLGAILLLIVAAVISFWVLKQGGGKGK